VMGIMRFCLLVMMSIGMVIVFRLKFYFVMNVRLLLN